MSSEIRFNAVIPPPRAKEKAAELAAMSTTHKGFGHEDLPKSHDYREYIQYAGTSGSCAEYDEETGTMKIIFTETPMFHKLTGEVPDGTDFGTAKFAMVVQKSEQLRLLAKHFLACAEGFECLLDPDYEYREELMGRKEFDKTSHKKVSK